jgi:hypothetical protein
VATNFVDVGGWMEDVTIVTRLHRCFDRAVCARQLFFFSALALEHTSDETTGTRSFLSSIGVELPVSELQSLVSIHCNWYEAFSRLLSWQLWKVFFLSRLGPS